MGAISSSGDVKLKVDLVVYMYHQIPAAMNKKAPKPKIIIFFIITVAVIVTGLGMLFKSSDETSISEQEAIDKVTGAVKTEF